MFSNRLENKKKKGLKLKRATNGSISRLAYLAKKLKTKNASIIPNHAYLLKLQNKIIKLNI